MAHFSSLPCPATARPWLLALLLLLAAPVVRAQAPAWGGAVAGLFNQPGGMGETRAVALDASGNIFVTGAFSGQIAFGNTLLTSAGQVDLFVAKYVPATDTWAWAQSGGGFANDAGSGIAVHGNSVYVTGYFTNSAANIYMVRFGGTNPATNTSQINGSNSTANSDLLLAKYTDNGNTGSYVWSQVGGGGGPDGGGGVVVNGTNVYMTGYFSNDKVNSQQVLFGGGGTTAGTIQVNGVSNSTNPDLVLIKYADNGSTGSYVWSQVGGGTGSDSGFGIAVSGASIYVTGSIYNDIANSSTVLFGGGGTTAGTIPIKGASVTNASDLLLAKYTDNGSTGSYGWVQVGGGRGYDTGTNVAVSGTSVYVTGYLNNTAANNNTVVFGSNGSAAGTAQVRGASAAYSNDLLLAKYTDNGTTGSYGWIQVGSGTGDDGGNDLAVSGTSIYVTGILFNN